MGNQPSNHPTIQSSVSRAAGILRQGGLVIMPTDTVYGVAADPANADAVRHLYVAKGRDDGKPVALLAADLAAVEKYGAVLSPTERALAQAFWPGALTLVLKTATGPEGFRVPDCAVACELLRAAGGVLRVTSANRSGEPPALTAAAATSALQGFVDATIDGGPSTGGVASTVVEVDGSKIRVLREGALSLEDLEVEFIKSCGKSEGQSCPSCSRANTEDS